MSCACLRFSTNCRARFLPSHGQARQVGTRFRLSLALHRRSNQDQTTNVPLTWPQV